MIPCRICLSLSGLFHLAQRTLVSPTVCSHHCSCSCFNWQDCFPFDGWIIFHCMCVHVCTHCVYNFLYSSIHQPTLRFLYSLNIMNNAAMNMGADISLKQSFCFLQIYTEKWDCWINDRSFFNFLRNLHTISIVIGTIIVLNPCSQTFQQAISTQTCHDYISCS